MHHVFGSVNSEGTLPIQRSRTAFIALRRSGPLRAFLRLMKNTSSLPAPAARTARLSHARAGNIRRLLSHEVTVTASRISEGFSGNVLRVSINVRGIVRLSAVA